MHMYLELNSHYTNLLETYMREMEFKDLNGKKLTKPHVCRNILMDVLDELQQNKLLLEQQSTHLQE